MTFSSLKEFIWVVFIGNLSEVAGRKWEKLERKQYAVLEVSLLWAQNDNDISMLIFYIKLVEKESKITS